MSSRQIYYNQSKFYINSKNNYQCLCLLFFAMKVYSPGNNHKFSKIEMTAKIFNKEIHHESIPFSHKNTKFQQQNPCSSIPALQINSHEYVFGTHSIMRHLAPQNYSLGSFKRAEINEWLEIIEKTFENAVGVFILSEAGSKDVGEEHVAKAQLIIDNILKKANQKLKLRTFLVGDTLTIADISLFCSFDAIRQYVQEDIVKYKKKQKIAVTCNDGGCI